MQVKILVSSPFGGEARHGWVLAGEKNADCFWKAPQGIPETHWKPGVPLFTPVTHMSPHLHYEHELQYLENFRGPLAVVQLEEGPFSFKYQEGTGPL